MDELDLSGKKYISSKRAAELTGYAKDYIGQLARAGKISATRFGRAWYVEEGSIMAHANADKADIAPVEAVSAPQKSDIQPAQAGRPQLPQHFYKPYAFPKTWRSVQYFHDHSELLPALKKPSAESSEITNKNIATSVTLDISGEKNVAIKKEEMHAPAPLPEAPIRIIPGVNFDIPQPRKSAPQAVRIVPVKVARHQAPNGLGLAPYAAMAGAAALLVVSFGLLRASVQSNFTDIASTGYYTASAFSSVQGFLNQLFASDYIQGGISAISGFGNLLSVSFWSYAEQGFSFLQHLF